MSATTTNEAQTRDRDAIHTSGLLRGAWGFPLVKGKCPACGAASLFLAVGGYVTCSVIGCPEPDAASKLLGTP